MTPTGLWLDIGAGENGFTKLLRLLFLAAGVGVFYLSRGSAADLAATGGVRAC